MNFLVMLMNQKTKVNPKSCGFVHKKAKDEINLRSFYISKDYINPFVQSLQLSNKLKKLNLCRTQLSVSAAEEVIKNLPTQLEDLNLSGNPNVDFQVMKSLR